MFNIYKFFGNKEKCSEVSALHKSHLNLFFSRNSSSMHTQQNVWPQGATIGM